MNWKKLGKIFDPTNQQLSHNCFEFAQSPQTIVFDDYVRIYFSTREKDPTGKFLSHVSYVDFDFTFTKILKVSNHTIIPLGDLGCFDEHGIFPFNVLKHKEKIFGYTTGWNRKISVSADASIGYSISIDGGESFTKFGKGPVMTASLQEPFLVCDAFVQVFNEIYHMWYIFGEKWIASPKEKEPQRVYKIAHATSLDGINWIKDGKKIIKDFRNENECQALPSVIEHKGKYHMYFCHRDAFEFRTIKEKSYKMGYAFSDDLVNWTRDDSLGGLYVADNSWDSEMICYPHIFHCNNKVYMLYNGNEFGKYGFGLAILVD